MRIIDEGLGRTWRTAALAFWGVVGAGLCAHVANMALAIAGGPTSSLLSGSWLYLSVLLGAGGAILVRALTLPAERLAWALIGLGVLGWSFGEVYWRSVMVDLADPPFPSLADALYLSFYPAVYAGLVLLIRARVRHFHASQWLDGLAAALIIAATAAAFLLPTLLDGSSGSVAAVATNLAYPLGDLIVLGLVAALAALTNWRPGRAIGLLAVGCVIFALADVLFLLRAASGTVADLGASELLWPCAMVMIGLAAWQGQRLDGDGRLEGWSLMIIPTAVSFASLGVVADDHWSDQGPLPMALAIAALVVCMARAALTFRENIALADSHRQAVTDSLTGLPNRRLFLDRAERATAAARRDGERVGVMIIDLDRFKEVNDTLGHHSGDVMLREIARRLTAAVRESDTIARLGGDEFAVLLPDLTDAAGAETVARTLGDAIATPIILGALSLDTEASIGIAVFPDDGDDVTQLLQRADVAMYTAKAQHLGHAFYGPENDNYSPERLALVGELRRALGENELVLLYQPKVDLTSGRISSVEVLIRWQHPGRGLLSPAEFVPLAELTTLIRPLTLHVLNRALLQVRDWNRDGRDLTVAVNVSARNLLDPDFPDAVLACLELWDVPPERLELEVTETVLMADPARALEVLNRLSEAGVGLSIDDFGTGYSSLEYLKRLPVDVLKIDKSFVLNMSHDVADAMIVRSTIDLARNLGLRVVAEGIEDQSAYDMLQSLGCHLGQGFLMSRPVSAEQLETLLDDPSWAERTFDTGSGASKPAPG